MAICPDAVNQTRSDSGFLLPVNVIRAATPPGWERHETQTGPGSPIWSSASCHTWPRRSTGSVYWNCGCSIWRAPAFAPFELREDAIESSGEFEAELDRVEGGVAHTAELLFGLLEDHLLDHRPQIARSPTPRGDV
jgi:hypothetical protein